MSEGLPPTPSQKGTIYTGRSRVHGTRLCPKTHPLLLLCTFPLRTLCSGIVFVR